MSYSWACPYCRVPVDDGNCGSCGRAFRSANGKLDFRPTAPMVLDASWRYDPAFEDFPWEIVQLDWPDLGNGVALDESDEIVERRMLQSVPRGSGVALDIGCGTQRQRFRRGLASLGYAPLGLDVEGDAPDALGDAHLLPLLDDSIDLLMSSSVWEHLRHPHRAMAEAGRVLKPGGLFVGAIAFSEPYHGSYFHHSPLAVLELMHSNGLRLDYVVLQDKYSAFRAHMQMGTAGRRLPMAVRGRIGDIFWWLAVGPSMLKGTTEYARRFFARSHAAAVGFSARKR